MIVDLQSTLPPGVPEDAVCVIGGGAVGLCIAVALARRGVRVALLEGGGQTLEPLAQSLQDGESIGQPFNNIGVGRYRVLGGSTVFWGGQVLPFDRFVRGARPWAGHKPWPIDDTLLEPYFAKAYDMLGLQEACLDDAAIWKAIGVSDADLGHDIDFLFTRWVKTRNLALLFKKELRQLGNLVTVVHANVCALNMTDDRGAIRSVTVRDLSGKSFEFSARSFVLANGTLEMARLLMHPTGDGGRASWHGARYLGMPLIDHLDCNGGDVRITDHPAAQRIFDNVYLKGHKYYPRMRLSPGAQQQHGLLDVAAQFLYRTRFTEHLEYLKMFLRSVKEGAEPVSVAKLPHHLAAVAKTALPLALRYFKDRRSFKPHDAEVRLAFYCEQLPSTQSRLELSDARDPLGMRRLKVHWHIDGREIRTVKFFALRIQKALESRGLAKIDLDPLLLDEDPRFIEGMHDGVHQMGTARMASSPEEGVVDADLKVFGTRNLYLAGAAVFPSTGFANPTFTAIALALRLADHLFNGERRATAAH